MEGALNLPIIEVFGRFVSFWKVIPGLNSKFRKIKFPSLNYLNFGLDKESISKGGLTG